MEKNKNTNSTQNIYMCVCVKRKYLRTNAEKRNQADYPIETRAFKDCEA